MPPAHVGAHRGLLVPIEHRLRHVQIRYSPARVFRILALVNAEPLEGQGLVSVCRATGIRQERHLIVSIRVWAQRVQLLREFVLGRVRVHAETLGGERMSLEK